MNIEKIDTGHLVSKITFTLQPEDYYPVYSNELKKLKGRVSLKGFRQGKTPDHVVAKMYGEQVLADVINNLMAKNLDQYIKDQDMNVVCQPLVSANQELLALRPSDKTAQYDFSYDIGVYETINLVGVSPTDSYSFYKIDIKDTDLEEELTKLAESMGSIEVVEAPIDEFDQVEVSAVELNDDNTPKKDGWQSNFDFHISSIGTENIKNDLLGKEKGYKFNTALNDLTSMSEQMIREQWLSVEKDDDREIGLNFEITIESIMRKAPMNLNDESIAEKFAQHGIETLDQLKEKLKENKEYEVNSRATGKMFDEFHNRIFNETNVEFSPDFVKRWLVETEKLEADKIEEMYESFEKDLKWSLIQNELQKKYNVTLSAAEVDSYFRYKGEEFMQQFGYFDESILQKVIARYKEDQNEVYKANNLLISNKIFAEVEKSIVKVEEEVSLEEFNKLTAPKQSELETVS
jgi:trigger factor